MSESTPARFPPSVYVVELLYEQAPALSHADLLAKLRQHCGNVEPLDPAGQLLSFVFVDHPVGFANNVEVPAQCLIAPADRPPDPKALEPALGQTWNWPQAREVVGRCRASLLVSDMMARGLEYHARLNLFHGVLRSVLELAPCRAIHWQPSQQVVDPAAYLQAQQPGEGHNPLVGPVNVRLFNIKGGTPGELLMDTMGLATLGLPDLQCHFVGLDPRAVAGLLYNASVYVFQKGDVIADGHTIQGLTPQQRWRCQHEKALVGPDREVLDLNPGPPHAAGGRE